MFAKKHRTDNLLLAIFLNLLSAAECGEDYHF
jgi:hypothetical protein